MTDDHATLLAELRSLMQLPFLDLSQREKLWALLVSSAEDASAHAEVIIPYLSGFNQHFSNPLRHLWSLHDLREAVSIAPFASFQCTFTFTPGMLEQLLDSNLSCHIAHLTARCCKPHDIVRLSRSMRFEQLTHLDLSNNAMSEKGMEALCEARFMPRLRRLTLHANALGDGGARVLAALGRRLTCLEHLDLANNAIGAPGIQAIASSGLLDGLMQLDLRRNVIGLDGARALVHEANLSRLENLRISNNPLGDEGLEVLAGSPRLANLRGLELYHTRIGIRGVDALLSSPHIDRLFTLDLSSNHLGDDAIAHLATSPRMKSLCSLGLANNRLTDRSARALSSSPHLRHLNYLSIGSNFITAAGIRMLNESPHLENLSPLMGTVPRRA